jgi:dihydrolipoamide dehydrogenase
VSILEVAVPDIGDFTDVPVIEIHVAPGDAVAVEDPLVTLESDKATMDIPAPRAGIVKQLRVKLGDRVSEGSVLLTIDSVDSATPDAPPAPDGAASVSAAAAPAGAAPSLAAPPPAAPGASDGQPDADVVVIGAGPGGYAAAFRAADLGLKVILVERHERLGGVCLNVGCIPSKTLLHAARAIAEAEEMAAHGISFGKPKIDLPALRAWKESVVERLTGGLDGLAKRRKVEVVRGEARFAGPHALSVGERALTFASCVIAVGSRPIRLSFLPDDPRVIDSTGALTLDDLPKRLLVIGGGIIGLEMATVYDALGSRVTVVELMEGLIPGCDRDLVAVLQKRIESRYESVRTGVEVVAARAQKNGIKVEFAGGQSDVFDRVLVAVGRAPNGGGVAAEAAGVEADERGFIRVDRQMRTNVPWIYAIGDVVGGPMLAHKATYEGHVVAEVIAGETGAQYDARAIPSVAYTDPEVAWMGLTETEAVERGIEFEKATFPWAASGRALSLGREDGLTKILLDPVSHRILGAAMVGVNAGELVAETVLALEMGADVEDVGMTIHPHPTLSESVMMAAEMAAGTITDLMPPRRRAART